jgi:hypothetical protein
MVNRTAWTAGNGVGYTWTTAINSSDLATMPSGQIVLSTVADVANQGFQDMFMDISVRCAIASSTLVVGANLALYLYYLLDDNTTYGDGQLTPGTQAAKTPAFPSCCNIPLFAGAAQTILTGINQQPIPILPGSFRLALQNNSGFTFSGTQIVKYRTYNLQLNN